MFRSFSLFAASLCALATLAAAQAPEPRPSAEPGRPRVYVTAEATKSGGSDAVAGGGQGSVDPQRDEVIKTLLKNCPGVAVTMDADKADFHLDMQREPNKGYLRKRDKWVLTAHNGDVLGAGSVRSVGNVVKDACTLMTTPH